MARRSRGVVRQFPLSLASTRYLRNTHQLLGLVAKREDRLELRAREVLAQRRLLVLHNQGRPAPSTCPRGAGARSSRQVDLQLASAPRHAERRDGRGRRPSRTASSSGSRQSRACPPPRRPPPRRARRRRRGRRRPCAAPRRRRPAPPWTSSAGAWSRTRSGIVSCGLAGSQRRHRAKRAAAERAQRGGRHHPAAVCTESICPRRSSKLIDFIIHGAHGCQRGGGRYPRPRAPGPLSPAG